MATADWIRQRNIRARVYFLFITSLLLVVVAQTVQALPRSSKAFGFQ